MRDGTPARTRKHASSEYVYEHVYEYEDEYEVVYEYEDV